MANTTIDLGDYFQKDGTTITLGDTTYTIAVGKDSKFKDGENVIDLTDMASADIDGQNDCRLGSQPDHRCRQG